MCFAALLLLVLSIVLVAPSHAASNTPIFVLHSYSQEYPWTKRQHEGFLRKLGAAVPDTVSASVEYLDTKRVPYTAAYADLIAAHLARKYAGFEPKLIYVTDDNALLFALTHLTRIFPKAPVFFSGINDYSVKQRIDAARVTGVFENKEIAPNLELMQHLAPGVSDILVVGDESETYQSIRGDIMAELVNRPGIQAQFVSSGRIERLVALLRGRSEKFVFLTTLGAMTDAAGYTLTLPETISAIVQAGKFIIISMEDVYLFSGVLGGYVTSGHRQGEAAAGLVARFLSGSAVAAIKPIEASPNEYIFDGAELEKLGLKLPPELAQRATIVNSLPTFYERNLTLIVRTLYAFALLFVVSLAAFIVALMRKNRHIARTSTDLAAQADRLRETQENLVQAQRIAGVGSWEWTRAGDTITWSEGANAVVGRNPASPAPTSRTLSQFYLPESWDRLQAAVARARETGAAFELELEMIRGDGTTCWTRTRGEAVRGPDGAIVKLLGTVHDIDRQKRADMALRASEEKFARAFRASPMFVAISTAADGRYIDVNEAALTTMGYTREEIIGRTASDIRLWVKPEDRQRAIDAMLKDGRISGIEAELRKKSGEAMIGEIWGEPIVVDGQPCVIWVTKDVTERNRAEAEIHRINAELEQRVEQRTHELQSVNRELESFAYSVSHDLRAPLRAIEGFSSLLEEDYAAHVDERGKDYLRRVRGGATRMATLIDDLLNLARISRREVRRVTVDLSALAREVAEELQATEPGRRVEWAIAPQVSASGDLGLLRVVLQNLIGNAWKYSSKREMARIEFGVNEADGRRSYFVRDNGDGFDMTYAGKLFGAFQRLHSPEAFPGTGIGLATVKRIIHLHGGEVGAQGKAGEGASFHFTLG